MPAKVAVILPSFNRPNMIRRAINSVLNQTYNEFTLYIMDNSSCQLRPRMKKIYEEYAQKDSRVRVDYTNVPNNDRWKKVWVAVVTNKCLFKVCEREPYVVFMADDNWMHPKKLETLVTFLDQHPHEGMVAGKLQVYGRNGRVLQTFGGVTVANAFCRLDFVQPMIRRKVIDKVPRFQEMPFNPLVDARFWQSIARLGVRACGVPTVLDRMPGYTKQTCMNPTKRARAERGEIME